MTDILRPGRSRWYFLDQVPPVRVADIIGLESPTKAGAVAACVAFCPAAVQLSLS